MPTDTMWIGEAAAASGVTVKGIRHYEAMGMLPGIRRTGSYRELSASHYGVAYHAAFVLDPDGHNVEAVLGGVG